MGLVYLRRQHVFEAILRYIRQYVILRNITHSNLPALGTSTWLSSHKNINDEVLARAD